MGFDRGWTYGQSSGDLRIVQPLDHQGENFTLALRQVKTGRWRLIGYLDQGLSGTSTGPSSRLRPGAVSGPGIKG